MPLGIVASQGMEEYCYHAGVCLIHTYCICHMQQGREDKSGLLYSNYLIRVTWLFQDFGTTSCLQQEAKTATTRATLQWYCDCLGTVTV